MAGDQSMTRIFFWAMIVLYAAWLAFLAVVGS